MGLAQDLDYRHRAANPVQNAVRWAAGTRAGAWASSHVLRHFDSSVGRLTRGRHTAASLVTGIAVLSLTTTGRRSRERRNSHLIATPLRGDLALLGTNFGQTSTPAWALNLESDPRCSVTYRGRTLHAMARAATPEEVEEVFTRASSFYAGYRHYRSRIGDRRQVRVFLLCPRVHP
ncbi:nitroreductase family deazaflavin-dependent oxidoreductase [Knoellia locipacati]|uniref:nitroreductase family deazaflavin-dependent oxidoreductase n=1 Tax=Knoellia locipacati TaxID=882824 RepID=UPI00384C1574